MILPQAIEPLGSFFQMGLSVIDDAGETVATRRHFRSAEANYLIKSCGWPPMLARETVGIDEAFHDKAAWIDEFARCGSYMPTPTEIRRACESFLSGEIKLGRLQQEFRARQRGLMQLPEPTNDDAESIARANTYELAGIISDDTAAVPAWFRG